jgi:hypothetical protein
MGGGIVSGEFRVCAATENQKALTLRKKCESLVIDPSVTYITLAGHGVSPPSAAPSCHCNWLETRLKSTPDRERGFWMAGAPLSCRGSGKGRDWVPACRISLKK